MEIRPSGVWLHRFNSKRHLYIIADDKEVY